MADEERKKICIQCGDGIGFTGTDADMDYTRKLTVKIPDNSKLIELTPDGLYVGDLTGKNGTAGGSRVDNFSIQEGTSYDGKPFPTVNRNVVCLIYSLCAYTIGTRTKTYLTPTTTVKTVSDIIAEYNGPTQRTAVPQTGELIQLMTEPSGALYGGNVLYEDLNRYATAVKSSNYKTLALFVITDIKYNGNKMQSLQLTCLYSSLPNFTKGEQYT